MEREQTDTVVQSTVPIGWVSLLILATSFLLIQPTGNLVAYLPFIVSVFVLGMPHGAVDHLVPRYLTDTNTKYSVLVIVILYAVLGIAYTLLWFVQPFASLLLFILLTILHWGQGDNYVYSVGYNSEYASNKIGLVSGVLLKGSLPMLLPYIFHEKEYIDVVNSIVSLFDPTSSAYEILQMDSTMVAVTAFFTIITAIYFLNALRYGVTKSFKLDSFEVAFLVVFFYAMPPVYAIGTYFCFWHATRHIGRLMNADDKKTESGQNVGKLIKRFIYVSTPMTVGGIILFIVIAVITDASLMNYQEFLSSYLIAISVMTLPHFVVVSWMDKKQRVYEFVSL